MKWLTLIGLGLMKPPKTALVFASLTVKFRNGCWRISSASVSKRKTHTHTHKQNYSLMWNGIFIFNLMSDDSDESAHNHNKNGCTNSITTWSGDWKGNIKLRSARSYLTHWKHKIFSVVKDRIKTQVIFYRTFICTGYWNKNTKYQTDSSIYRRKHHFWH